MAIFRRILVATDFSDASQRALDLALAMVRESGANLYVVHVCEIPYYGDFTYPVDLVTPLTDAAQGRLEELIASLRRASPDAKGVLKVGLAWEQILAVAAEERADVIVMGTHGRRGVAHAIMGSVAERVVRVSAIPVLTVRGREAAGPGATSP